MVRKIKAKLVLRLRSEGLSRRQIAAQGMSRRSVDEVIAAADAEGLTYGDVAALPDAGVYARLFPGRGEYHSVYGQPDWDEVHRELAKVGVTLKLLHGEYRDVCQQAGTPGMGYDRFCKTYQQHVLVAGLASRVGHKAGQSVEVDWSGKTMVLTDPVTGKQTKVFLFVACFPFSRFAFVEPSLDMKQDAWLRAHTAMFNWFGGSVPRIVPDNLKTGVIAHPTEGEVVLNDAYRELAAHYSAAVLPGRVRKPKDKASVENTVGNIATGCEDAQTIVGVRVTRREKEGRLREVGPPGERRHLLVRQSIRPMNHGDGISQKRIGAENVNLSKIELHDMTIARRRNTPAHRGGGARSAPPPHATGPAPACAGCRPVRQRRLRRRRPPQRESRTPPLAR